MVVLRFVPKAKNSGQKIRRVHYRGGVTCSSVRVMKVGRESNGDRDVVSDVMTALVVVREGVNKLLWK
jgi:hypothetical protein